MDNQNNTTILSSSRGSIAQSEPTPETEETPKIKETNILPEFPAKLSAIAIRDLFIETEAEPLINLYNKCIKEILKLQFPCQIPIEDDILAKSEMLLGFIKTKLVDAGYKVSMIWEDYKDKDTDVSRPIVRGSGKRRSFYIENPHIY